MSEDIRYEIMGLMFMAAVIMIAIALFLCLVGKTETGSKIGIAGAALLLLSANFPK